MLVLPGIQSIEPRETRNSPNFSSSAWTSMTRSALTTSRGRDGMTEMRCSGITAVYACGQAGS